MRRLFGVRLLFVLLGASALGAMGWLIRENASLRDRLRESEKVARAADPSAASESGEPREARTGGRSGGDPMKLLRAVGKALEAGGDPPEGAPAVDDEKTRRDKRQRRVREMLGRRPGESEEAYRARVAPGLKLLLALPRTRMDDRKDELAEAAGFTPEQRQKLDGVLADAQAELIAQANQAVASGQLTPYKRNSLGVLGFVAGSAAAFETADQRLRELLGRDQAALLEATGFDLVEYLAITAPWETLKPPPPPPP